MPILAVMRAWLDEVLPQVPPTNTDDIDPFTPEEQIAILGKLVDQGRNFIQFAFWTGGPLNSSR
jgi:hypothetical protein